MQIIAVTFAAGGFAVVAYDRIFVALHVSNPTRITSHYDAYRSRIGGSQSTT